MTKTNILSRIVVLMVAIFTSSCNRVVYNIDFDKPCNDKSELENWQFLDENNHITLDSTHSNSGTVSLTFNKAKDINNNCIAICNIDADTYVKKLKISANYRFNNLAKKSFNIQVIADKTPLKSDFSIDGNSTWEKRRVIYDIDRKIGKLTIVFSNNGDSEVGIDDIKIELFKSCNRDNSYTYPAENDKEFDNGSKIDNIDLTESNIENLYQLGLIWGFLKYYHPAIAKGEYNWDYELFRIIPKILDCKDNETRDEILTKLIKSLGKFKKEKAIEIIENK